MNAEMRRKLLAASTSGENTAAKGVTGKIRDLFERFIEPENGSIPSDLLTDMDYAYAGADFGTISIAAAGIWSMNRYKAAVKEGRAPEEEKAPVLSGDASKPAADNGAPASDRKDDGGDPPKSDNTVISVKTF